VIPEKIDHLFNITKLVNILYIKWTTWCAEHGFFVGIHPGNWMRWVLCTSRLRVECSYHVCCGILEVSAGLFYIYKRWQN
jgi:hypothetical protein